MTDANDFDIRRVYDPGEPGTGRRVLVDRLWPRGIAKASAPRDEWLKAVAPSPDLRRWYGHRAERFSEFTDRYFDELDDAEHREALEHLRRLGDQGRVVLLTATRDVEVSHVPTLVRKLAADD